MVYSVVKVPARVLPEIRALTSDLGVYCSNSGGIIGFGTVIYLVFPVPVTIYYNATASPVRGVVVLMLLSNLNCPTAPVNPAG